MNRRLIFEATLCVSLSLFLSGCGKVSAQQDAKATPAAGPAPNVVVEPIMDANNFKVDHPEQFPLVAAGEHLATTDINTTGVVNPDVSKQVPVPSLATGKIVEIDAQLGDEVKAGQVLFKVQSSDIAGAYSDYRKAIKNEELAVDNEHLTKLQQDRAKYLFDNGAFPKSAVEIADNAEVGSQVGLANARVDVATTIEHLRLLGSDPDHPSGIVEVHAPISGVITDQEITNGAAVNSFSPSNANTNQYPFTISDVSHVWIICDVWENNMAQIHIGQYADLHLVAYPDRVLKARIGNILPIIDPNIRTAKVRLEVENPGLMRIGMFVTATFHGDTMERHATVPDTAILHLHDREWVYVPLGGGRFKRQEVVSGNTLPDKTEEIVSGLNPGDQVVSRALVFQNAVEQ